MQTYQSAWNPPETLPDRLDTARRALNCGLRPTRQTRNTHARVPFTKAQQRPQVVALWLSSRSQTEGSETQTQTMWERIGAAYGKACKNQHLKHVMARAEMATDP